MLGAGGIVVNKTDKIPTLRELTVNKTMTEGCVCVCVFLFVCL